VDGGPAVLVVEDDRSIQSIVEDTLRDGGFEPTVSSLSEDALALLSATSYRALIIDISFGSDHIKGWDVVRRARAVNPALPVIWTLVSVLRTRLAQFRFCALSGRGTRVDAATQSKSEHCARI
jgi:DNA-binding NtrC family response regulator